ncbi:MAG: hypothetical protein K8R77_09040 [Anaerolineaceae bacterium]|nr:hypothetical protein [Anaerolineaceae bacterium]
MNQIETTPSVQIEEKPAMSKEHRKQVVWMIWVPFAFAVILILAVAVLVSLPTANTGVDTSSLGSLSFIWVSAPALLALLVIVALAGAMVYLVAKFLNILPGFFHKAQFYADFGARKTREIADKIVAPVITVKGHQASLIHLAQMPGTKTENKE